ncbi:MAG: transglycosylase SLT domain-containing protein [Trueperaceae bacterium]
MPTFPGLMAMPTVLANAALSFVPDRSIAVRGPDRVAAVSPMFDEEAGAAAALTSLLAQTVPLDELAVSINGGTDATLHVVRTTLEQHGFARVHRGPAPGLEADFERWHRATGPAVVVLAYRAPVAKSDSVNAVVEGGFVTAERVLVVDGDTVFDPGFVAALKDAFYRLERVREHGRTRFVLRDVALQSGAVQSARPRHDGAAANWISRARSAEYAFSAVLRRGQTARVGRGATFGSTRLYTVVGCGFVARRGAFPMPPDTLTEDHDFTLAVQNARAERRSVDPRALHERGFRLVLDGQERSPLEVFDAGDEIEMSRSPDARFVTEALMYTEDPPHLSGYVRQLERWNGGGIENVLKRALVPAAWRAARPNVRFALLAAQLENLVGLALLALVPILLGMGVALPGKGAPLGLLAGWFVLDLLVTLALVSLGFARLGRAMGKRGASRWRHVLRSSFGTIVPLFALKYLGAVAFSTAATRVVPKFLGRAARDPRVTATWDRPRAVAPKRVHVRTAGVAATMLLASITLFAVAAHVATIHRPSYKSAWQLTHGGPRVLQEEHAYLPLTLGAREASEVLERVTIGLAAVTAGDHPGAFGAAGGTDRQERADGVSDFCRPAFVAGRVVVRGGGHGRVGTEWRRLDGDPSAYRSLSPWGLLVLARLAPLLTHLEEAATAYDLPPRFLLQVLMNESYLDPLAVGPTGDLGLAQVTSDALTLLRAVSSDSGSDLGNERLFGGSFSVFDPDFSVCAGAAKLAWARMQPGGDSDEVAYALYINPLDGAVRGRVSARHAALVEPMMSLAPLVDALAATVAAYRQDPGQVASEERALLDIATDVRTKRLGLTQAYFHAGQLARAFQIDDLAFYDAVLERLYGTSDAVSTNDDPAEVPAG